MHTKTIRVTDHNGRHVDDKVVNHDRYGFEKAWGEAWDAMAVLYPKNKFYMFCTDTEIKPLPDPVYRINKK